MSKPKTGLESLGSQIAYRSKTLLLHNFKWREIIHCKTDRVYDMDLVRPGPRARDGQNGLWIGYFAEHVDHWLNGQLESFGRTNGLVDLGVKSVFVDHAQN